MKTVIEMATAVGYPLMVFDNKPYISPELERLVAAARADEREHIAQMIDNAPALVEYVTNDQGGCLMCGFTPRLAAASIRARGQE